MTRQNLATLDRDIGQMLGRPLQEAMAHGIENDMIFGGLVTGQSALQGIHTGQAVQNCLVPTRRVKWDGRVYRYARASNIITQADFGLFFYNQIGDGIAANLAAIAAVNASTITIAAAGVVADEFAYGYCVIHLANNVMNRGIISNTATSGGLITLTLDEALTATTGLTYTEIIQNPYNNVALMAGPSGGHAGVSNTSVAGIPNCLTAAINHYLWLQTWGPRFIHPHGDAGTGVAVGERKLVFDGEGSVCVADETGHGGLTSTDGDEQVAGFIIERGGNGPPFVMLQISP